MHTLVEPLASQLVPAGHPAAAPVSADVPADAHPLHPRTPLRWQLLAPRLTAAVLAALGVAEVLHEGLTLLRIPAVPAPMGALEARTLPVHGWQLSGAHLFGVEPSPAQKAAEQALARSVSWTLTGVIATGDPSTGFAIVGERGSVLQVLRAGSPLEAIPGSHLAKIYSDHVVIDLHGQLQSVALPRDVAATGLPAAGAMPPPEGPPETPPEPFIPEPAPRALAATESVYGALSPEPYQPSGRMAGMTLHPAAALQRRSGLRDGDVATAINGVEITDPGALESILRNSGESVLLTVRRDGVEQTVSLATTGR